MPAFHLFDQGIEAYLLAMRLGILSSFHLVGASMLLVLTAVAHPTNGHLCTEILNAQDCFFTEGFCEWVQGHCIYRCDLHNGQSDCDQIKEGCNWDGTACIEVGIIVDSGLSASDTGSSRRDTGTHAIVDAMQTDILQTPIDAQFETGDGLVDRVDSERTDKAPQKGELATGCSNTSSPALTSPVMLGLLFLARRKRAC
ncbi:MAG: hypothetical protein ACPGQS_14680 [Bradymonadia bacterium]